MSFLAPIFLIGGLAIALPVIFHLIRRTTRERTIFSSLMFLLPSPPRLTRRSRLEHIVLLVLRCGVLCLLAAGFARPFLKRPATNEPPPGMARRVVVLVDTSASMRRANLWQQARARVDSILKDTTPADQVALFTFDRQLRPVFTLEQWNAAPVSQRAALASSKLAEVSPTWFGTQLGDALISAAELLADGGSQASPRQIVVVSDLQEGSRVQQLQGYEWPIGLELSIETVKPNRAGNASLHLVAEQDSSKETSGVRVRVSNGADSRTEQFKIGWSQPGVDRLAAGSQSVYVPAGQSRIVSVALPTNGVATDRLLLEGDAEPFDNTVYVVPPEPLMLRVLYFGTDAEKDPRQLLYFLVRAFQQTGRQSVQVVSRTPAGSLNAADVENASLIVAADRLSPEQIAAFKTAVSSGKTVLFVLKHAAAGTSLAGLLGLDGLSLEEVVPSSYAMLGEIDFKHPLFAPFADPRFSDFTKIHFWKYRRIDLKSIPHARAVASFDNGDPAVFEVPLGSGRVVVLTSGWQASDSQLALSTKFVPLLYSLLEQASSAVPVPLQYYPGDPVTLSMQPSRAASALELVLPDGSRQSIPDASSTFSSTLLPGVYTMPGFEPPKRFVVNLDPSESRLNPLSADELERLGAPLAKASPAVTAAAAKPALLKNAELENRQKLWRWLIIAALGVIFAETWLAGRTFRRLRTEGGSLPA